MKYEPARLIYSIAIFIFFLLFNLFSIDENVTTEYGHDRLMAEMITRASSWQLELGQLPAKMSL